MNKVLQINKINSFYSGCIPTFGSLKFTLLLFRFSHFLFNYHLLRNNYLTFIVLLYLFYV